MGNWRTVYITGTCPPDEVTRLSDVLFCGHNYENFGPLGHTEHTSICGLDKWVAEKIHRIGNLAERDYSVKQVAEHLTKVVELSKATGLKIKIHCGADWEDDACVATIICENGKVEIRNAEIDTIPDIPDEQMKANFYDVILKPRS